jgi:uncharacterized membrane protein
MKTFFMKGPTTRTYDRVALFSLFLSTLGILIAGYLTVRHYDATEISVCPIFDNGCDTVTGSKYAVILGFLPLALLGVFYYATVFMLGALYAFRGNKGFMKLSSYISMLGALFSLLLLYVQGFVLHAYCFYCVSSAIVSLLLFIFEVPLTFYGRTGDAGKRVDQCMTVVFERTTK